MRTRSDCHFLLPVPVSACGVAAIVFLCASACSERFITGSLHVTHTLLYLINDDSVTFEVEAVRIKISDVFHMFAQAAGSVSKVTRNLCDISVQIWGMSGMLLFSSVQKNTCSPLQASENVTERF